MTGNRLSFSLFSRVVFLCFRHGIIEVIFRSRAPNKRDRAISVEASRLCGAVPKYSSCLLLVWERTIRRRDALSRLFCGGFDGCLIQSGEKKRAHPGGPGFPGIMSVRDRSLQVHHGVQPSEISFCRFVYKPTKAHNIS